MSASFTAAAMLAAGSISSFNSALARFAKAAAFSGLRLATRTRRSLRTAATAATWASACLPAPTSAISAASGAASHRVASPLIAAVRNCPERERLNHRHELAVGGVKQDQQGIRAALGVCPGLGADHSFGQHRCADRVQGVAMAERGMGLRHVDRAAPGLRREPALQRRYRIAHVDQRGDFRLRDPERLTVHRVATVHSCVIHKGSASSALARCHTRRFAI